MTNIEVQRESTTCVIESTCSRYQNSQCLIYLSMSQGGLLCAVASLLTMSLVGYLEFHGSHLANALGGSLASRLMHSMVAVARLVINLSRTGWILVSDPKDVSL